jgi:hypothetical protein
MSIVANQETGHHQFPVRAPGCLKRPARLRGTNTDSRMQHVGTAPRRHASGITFESSCGESPVCGWTHPDLSHSHAIQELLSPAPMEQHRITCRASEAAIAPPSVYSESGLGVWLRLEGRIFSKHYVFSRGWYQKYLCFRSIMLPICCVCWHERVVREGAENVVLVWSLCI